MPLLTDRLKMRLFDAGQRLEARREFEQAESCYKLSGALMGEARCRKARIQQELMAQLIRGACAAQAAAS